MTQKSDTSWIKDLIKNNKITYQLIHKTYLSTIVKYGTTEQIYEHFCFIFGFELRLYSEGSLKKGNYLLSEPQDCEECGEVFYYAFDGKNIKEVTLSFNKLDAVMHETKCTKVGSYSVDIKFPSGKIICGDWLPHASKALEDFESTCSINSKLGKYKTTTTYAKADFLHMFVGNTSPRIFYKDDMLLVGKYAYDDNENEIIPLKSGKEIGYICTDLWWVSIVDAEIYKSLLITKFGQIDGLSKYKEIKIIETNIKPGIYRCTYLGNNKFRKNTPNIFIKMQWLKDIGKDL